MKIVITADWHIDKDNRIEDMERTLDQLVTEVTKIQPDWFLFLGDAYKNWRPTPLEMKIFHDAMLTIAGVAKSTVILVGNHDYPESDEYRGLHCFTELKTLDVPVQVIDTPNIVAFSKDLAGIFIPHIPKNKVEVTYEQQFIKILRGLEEEVRMETPKAKAILFSHVYMNEAMLGANDMVITGGKGVSANTISSAGVNLGFFGDIHKSQRIEPGFYYPGSIERVNFGEREDTKGFIVYDTVTEGVDFIQLDARKMDDLIIDLVSPGFIKTAKQGDMLDLLAGDKPANEVFPLQYIQKALEEKREQLADAIVRIKIICTKEQKAALDGAEQAIEKIIMEDLKAHKLHSLSFDVVDNVSVRNAEVNESLSPQDALKKWAGMQEYDESTGRVIVNSGEKIIRG